MSWHASVWTKKRESISRGGLESIFFILDGFLNSVLKFFSNLEFYRICRFNFNRFACLRGPMIDDADTGQVL